MHKQLTINPFWAIHESAQSYLKDMKVPKADMPSIPAMPDDEIDANPVDAAYQITQSGTALISIVGVIVKYEFEDMEDYGYVSNLKISSAITQALNDPQVNRIVLYVDSPGGSVSGISDLGNLIFEANKIKPIVGYASDQACSAAYWILSQCSEIYANDTAMVGSIGTYVVLYDQSKMFDDAGIKVIVIKTGEFKGNDVEGLPITDKTIENYQKVVDAYTKSFVAAVARGRKLDSKYVETIANGDVWMGNDAIKYKLVDKISDLSTVINESIKYSNIIEDNSMELKKEINMENKDTNQVKVEAVNEAVIAAASPVVVEPAPAAPTVEAAQTAPVAVEAVLEAAKPAVEASIAPAVEAVAVKQDENLKALAYEDGRKDEANRLTALLAIAGNRKEFAIAQFLAGHDVSKAKIELQAIVKREQEEQAVESVVGVIATTATANDESQWKQDWENNKDNAKSKALSSFDYIAWMKWRSNKSR